MGASRRASLTDDWVDIGSDNLSVISWSGSDDDDSYEQAKAQAPQKPVYKPKLHIEIPRTLPEATAASPSPYSLPLLSDGFVETPTFGDSEQHYKTSLKGKEKAVTEDAGPAYVQDQEVIARLPSTPPRTPTEISDEQMAGNDDQWPANDGSSDGQPEEPVEELLDSHDVNPGFILKTLQSLDGIIDDAVQVLQEDFANERYLLQIPVIHGLRCHVAELKPIISGYDQLWYGPAMELPLDPGLHEWLSGVRVKMISLHAELQREIQLGQGGVGGNIRVLLIWEALENYQTQMEAFLPIMKADFDEFQISRMNFPIMPAEPSTPVRSAPIDIPQPNVGNNSQPRRPHRARPTSDGWLLRRELYNLKDELHRAIERLSDSPRPTQPSRKALANDVLHCYEGVFGLISELLSNHGSDWIESTISGGLTYTEFLALDADYIRDFTIQLERNVGCIPAVEKELEYSDTLDMGPRLSGDWLERLESIAQVLMATFKPDRN